MSTYPQFYKNSRRDEYLAIVSPTTSIEVFDFYKSHSVTVWRSAQEISKDMQPCSQEEFFEAYMRVQEAIHNDVMDTNDATVQNIG